MLLQNKNAVIYGAGGSLGGAIAREFARSGATVFISGHRLEPVRQLADEITKAGGKAEAYVVDALNETAVKDFTEKVAKQAGSLDISFNAISLKDVQNMPLTEMSVEDFARPVRRAMESQFITCTTAARIMMKQRSGVILTLTATPGGVGYPNVGGFGPACSAMEGFSRNLASELGVYGIRVVNIRSGGSPDSRVFREAIEQGGEEVAAFIDKMKEDSMLKAMPLMEDIANAAVFLASKLAAKITGVTIDITCGTTSGLNYKVAPIAFLKHED